MKNCDSQKKCKSGKVANTIRVRYNAVEQDVFYLCPDCTKEMQKQARDNSWQITVREYVCSPSKK